jgi:hypothetical protein
MEFIQILFEDYISFSLLIKKQLFIIFLPKKQWIYDHFHEFASDFWKFCKINGVLLIEIESYT